jgi:hypothetical protein
MRAMVEIVEEEATRSAGVPFSLVDFNGYHEFNKERMPEKGVAQYYFDPFHFTPRLGSQMMDLLMGPPGSLKATPPGSFGVLLNSSSIDVQIQAYREHRARFNEQRSRGE